MVRQGPLSVLAFAIRYRENPTGRAPIELRLSVVDGLATTGASRISKRPSLAKVNAEIDSRNLFIPSLSPVCRAVDTMLMFSVAAAALAAAVTCLVRVL